MPVPVVLPNGTLEPFPECRSERRLVVSRLRGRAARTSVLDSLSLGRFRFGPTSKKCSAQREHFFTYPLDRWVRPEYRRGDLFRSDELVYHGEKGSNFSSPFINSECRIAVCLLDFCLKHRDSL